MKMSIGERQKGSSKHLQDAWSEEEVRALVVGLEAATATTERLQLLGKVVRHRRKEMHISREELAHLLGVGVSWVLLLENGLLPTCEADHVSLDALARHLQLDTRVLKGLVAAEVRQWSVSTSMEATNPNS